MSKNYYNKSNSKNIFQLKSLAPEQLKAFQQFDVAVLKNGALSKKEKEIIAVAIAHVTECPYCIDTHTKKAKIAGASLEELVEAVFVTMTIEAGTVVNTRSISKNSNESLSQYAPDGYKGYLKFNQVAMQEGNLSAKFKEIIAFTVATTKKCSYSMNVHSKNALNEGATNEELAEAILVSSALCAGGAYAHMINMIQSYDE